MKLSTHFSWREVACKCGCTMPAKIQKSLEHTIRHLAESVRAVCGDRPCTVISGYRCPEYNAKARKRAQARGAKGPSRRSKHMYGLALDIRIKGFTARKVRGMILEACKAGRLPALGGLGLYRGWVHVDTWKRSDGRLRRWGR